MSRRTVLVVSGWIGTIGGVSMTAVSFAQGWQPPGFGTIGLGVTIIGAMVVIVHRVLQVAVSIGRIYHIGYEDGYARGHRDGRREGRPVLVEMSRHRETTAS